MSECQHSRSTIITYQVPHPYRWLEQCQSCNELRFAMVDGVMLEMAPVIAQRRQTGTAKDLEVGAKLRLLLATCKASVSIEVNSPRDVYLTVEQWLAERERDECPPDIDPEVRQKMIETNTVVEIHFYPTSPVGFYDIAHFDLNAALDMALDCLREEGLLQP